MHSMIDGHRFHCPKDKYNAHNKQVNSLENVQDGMAYKQ